MMANMMEKEFSTTMLDKNSKRASGSPVDSLENSVECPNPNLIRRRQLT